PVLGRPAERDLRSTRRIDEGPVEVRRDATGTGFNDPRADFARGAARIPDDESAQPAAVLSHQERGGKFLREPSEELLSICTEVLCIHPRQSGAPMKAPRNARSSYVVVVSTPTTRP